MRMKHTLLAAAALSLLSTTASAVDWGGYMRIGPGQKVEAGNGDASNCFQGAADTGGKGGIGRLGNECNTYGEFGLSQAGKAGGIDFKALLMTNFYQPGSDIGDGDRLGSKTRERALSGLLHLEASCGLVLGSRHGTDSASEVLTSTAGGRSMAPFFDW